MNQGGLPDGPCVLCVKGLLKSVGREECTFFNNKKLSSPLQYGIVIDSGSSRSSVYVYEWPGEKENETGVVTEIMNCRVAGESVSKTLQFLLGKALVFLELRGTLI